MRVRRGLIVLGGMLAVVGGCSGRAPPKTWPGGVQPLVFEGACDASGAVASSGGSMLVADDEDNVLRVYDPRRGGAPLRSVDLSPALGLTGKKKAPEMDLEAATNLGPWSLWLTSHGRSSSGKRAPSRLRFFATVEDGAALAGQPYVGLLDDLVAAPQLAPFSLAEAEALPPKTPGGLNIEGMTARPDGQSVLIGFRGPVPGGKALLVPLLNPREMLESGTPARFGEPVLLDLGGLGIRSLSWWRGRYLLVAGGVAGGTPSRLFTWRGGDDAPVPVALDLQDLNPEAFFSPETEDAVLLLSDDGTARVDGDECKRLQDSSRKRFRGLWVRLPESP